MTGLTPAGEPSAAQNMSLALRNVLFTIVVPGAGAVYGPWWILTRSGTLPEPVAWPALVIIAAGLALYLACLWLFASVGRGTPGPWDAPRRFVAKGPYRWVRNPMYNSLYIISFFLVSANWLIGLAWLTGYTVLMISRVPKEEALMKQKFGDEYNAWRARSGRFLPRFVKSDSRKRMPIKKAHPQECRGANTES